MKNNILLLFYILLTSNVFAQTIALDWGKSTASSSTGSAIGRSILTDNLGNVYTVGRFYQISDFDPGPGISNLTSNGSGDLFIQKLDATGNFIWAKSIGGMGDDYSQSFIIDNSGNLYITGIYYNTVDFDPGNSIFNLTSNGNMDVFCLKLDLNGNFLWAKSIGGTFVDYSYSIELDANNNVYILGNYTASVDFDPSQNNFNLTLPFGQGPNIFILKLDSIGNFIWVKDFGDGAGQGNDIEIDLNGNLLITGNFHGMVDFDPNAGIFNLTALSNAGNLFILKLNANGNFIWAKSIGGASSVVGNSIITSSTGDVYVTGQFYGLTVDFDPNSGTNNLNGYGSMDIFILKLDSIGNHIWSKSIGSTGYDAGYSISIDSSENIYITGDFENTVNFNPSAIPEVMTSNGLWDLFIHKLDSSGKFIWAHSIGSAGIEWARGISVDGSKNIYLTGYFQNTVDFDPSQSGILNLTASGNNDMYVLKFNCSASTGIDNIASCGPITWIDGSIYTSNNNTAVHTISGGALNGCDSIVTLNLTVNTLNVSTKINGILITANTSGGIYQWLDCDNNFAVIPNANSQSYTVTANGNYAVRVTKNGCTDTSQCINISNLEILENTAFPILPKIFPNPSSSTVNIKLIKKDDVRIKIFNTNFQLVYDQKYLNVNKLQLDLKESPGIYIIEIETSVSKTRHKLVLE